MRYALMSEGRAAGTPLNTVLLPLFLEFPAVPSFRIPVRQSPLSHHRIRGDGGKSVFTNGRIHLYVNRGFRTYLGIESHVEQRLPVLCRYPACRRASGHRIVHKSLQWYLGRRLSLVCFLSQGHFTQFVRYVGETAESFHLFLSCMLHELFLVEY